MKYNLTATVYVVHLAEVDPEVVALNSMLMQREIIPVVYGSEAAALEHAAVLDGAYDWRVSQVDIGLHSIGRVDPS